VGKPTPWVGKPTPWVGKPTPWVGKPTLRWANLLPTPGWAKSAFQKALVLIAHIKPLYIVL